MKIHLGKGEFSIGTIEQLPAHIRGNLLCPEKPGIEIPHFPPHPLGNSMGDAHILVVWRPIDRHRKWQAGRVGCACQETRVKAAREIAEHGTSRCCIARNAVNDNGSSSTRSLAQTPEAGFWLVRVPVLAVRK